MTNNNKRKESKVLKMNKEPKSKGIAKESFIKGAKFMLNHLKPIKCKCSVPQPSFINSNLCRNCMYEIK